MRKLFTTLLIAAAVLPAAAGAQSRGELARDRQDIRQEQRDLDRARARGDRDDIRDERRDVREARQEYREDSRDRDRRYGERDRYGRDDWRQYRNRDRQLYARGNFRAPFRYNSFRAGTRIAPSFYGNSYWISDPYRYHLPRAAGFQRWVRHYDDVLLVDTRRSIVVDVIRGFYF